MTLSCGGQENALLRPGAMTEPSDWYNDTRSNNSPLDFIIVDNKLLLQHLDGVQAARRLLLSQHHLTEIAFSKHGQKIEIIKANFSLLCYLRLLLLLGWSLIPLSGCLLLLRLLQWRIAAAMLRWCSRRRLIRLGREARWKRLLLWLR